MKKLTEHIWRGGDGRWRRQMRERALHPTKGWRSYRAGPVEIITVHFPERQQKDQPHD